MVSDGELDAVVVEAVDQSGFIESSSWCVDPSPVSDTPNRRKREREL